MKTIIVTEGYETKILNVETLQTDDSNIKISALNFEQHILLEIINNNLNNLLDFKGAANLKVLYLQDNIVKGGTYAINNHTGFMIQTDYKNILLSII